METINKELENQILALVVNDNLKEAMQLAISKGVTPKDFIQIAGKYLKL